MNIKYMHAFVKGGMDGFWYGSMGVGEGKDY